MDNPTPSAPPPSAAAAPSPDASGKDATQAPASPPAPAAAPDSDPRPPSSWRLRVYGEDREVPEDVYRQYAQKGAAAEHRFQEAARLKAEAEARLSRLKADPRAAIAELGLDPFQLALSWVTEQITDEGLSPEAQRAKQLERELAEHKEREAKAQEESKRAEVKRIAEAKGREYGQRFSAALEKAGLSPGDPAMPGLVMRMAHYQEQNEDAGLDLGPDVLAQVALEDIRAEHAAAWGRLEGDTLLSTLGDELVGRVVKASIARYEKQRAGAGQPPAPPQSQGAPKAPRDPGTGRFTSADRYARQFQRFTGG